METRDMKLVELIRSYLAGTLSEGESRELQKWLEESPKHGELVRKIQREIKISEELTQFCSLNEEKAWGQFKALVDRRKKKAVRYHFYRALGYAAAIAIPVVLALSLWIYRSDTGNGENLNSEILPGGSCATLVAADGRIYQLGDKLEVENVDVASAQQAKQLNNTLVYDTTRVVSPVEEFNELSIPRGGEFKIVLSDGTLVYLNSATRLKYPVTFSAKDRRVFLSGEAYFEVAKDSKRPFYVITDDMQVRVYGTEFGVNTRAGDYARTVLVEGSIGLRVKGIDDEVVMKPGELARYDKKEKTLIVRPVNVRSYVAWKEGYFAFENETLEQIMATLSLWYNVDVFFQSESVKNFVFTGFLRKYERIDSILVAIQDVTGVKYSINNRTVILSR